MEDLEKNIKKYVVVLIIALLAVLVFLVIKPVIISVIGGLLLAYIFFPLYEQVLKRVKNKNLSASIISIVVLLIIIVPLWFLIPIIIQQVFNIFTTAQSIDFQAILRALFPSSSEKFLAQTAVTLSGVVNKLSSAILNSLVNILVEVTTIALHLFILAFVFFYSLRDSDKLKEMVSSISPFHKNQEKLLVKQFKDISDSLIYGQIIVGIVQGILAGLGFIIFGVNNALVLTLLAILFSIIPFIGPSIVWVPVTVYMFASGNITSGVLYLMYNLLIVSTFDNILRSYLISKKTDISAAIVVVGMVGGLFVFGFMGLIIGPLVLAYFITFLRAYKEKALASLFAD